MIQAGRSQIQANIVSINDVAGAARACLPRYYEDARIRGANVSVGQHVGLWCQVVAAAVASQIW